MNILSLLGSMEGAVAQGLFYAVFALGVYITYKILDVADLTVDGSIVTGGAVAAVCIANGMNAVLAVFLAFLAGLVAGAITGFFHITLGIPAILAGILTQLSLYSINLSIMGGPNAKVSSREFPVIVKLSNNTQSMLVGLLFVVAVIALLYWFFGTEFGSSLRSTGANPHMSRAQGINTNFTTLFGLMLSNGFVAMAGGLFAQYNGNSDINFGRGAIVIGLASVIIGSVLCDAIFKKGANFAVKLAFVALGSVIYQMITMLIIQIGLPTDYLKLFSAVLVAIFLALPYIKGKYFHSKKGKGGRGHA
jgi:putative ABC transport system permease protein